MLDPLLESLIDHVLRPLSGDVGEDLAQTSSPELITIRNQFNDANRNFTLLYETGRDILVGKSKDLWAAWALVGGLLWSKQYEPAQGFYTSCRIVRGLCEQFWEGLYPESRGLKNTLLTQIAKWWNTFIVRCSEGSDKELLRQSHQELVALQQAVLAKVDGNTDVEKARAFNFLANLPQIIRALGTVTGSAPAEAKPESSSASESAATESSPRSESSSPMVAASDSLDGAFDKARDRIRTGNVEDGLAEFQATLRVLGDFADKFRGRVLLGELYLQAGLFTHAKRVLQYTHDEIDKIRLPDWEPKLCSRLFANLIQAHQRAKDEKPNEKLLGELFADLCLIDPSRAATLEPIKGS